MSETFDAGWLALREPFDAAARDPGLALRLVDALPVKPWLVDLGAGSGSLFRYLAPLIGREQSWTFVDADAGLLDEAFLRTAEWADALGLPISSDDSTLTIHAPGGEWRIDGELHDLSDMPGELPLREADAVVCSALLDLVSRRWLEKLADALHQPFYAALSVDGRDEWLPSHPADIAVRVAFRRDQGRDKGFGRALGLDAVAGAIRVFEARGFRVASAPSDWIIPRMALAMQEQMIIGAAAAASVAMPARGVVFAQWRAERMNQAMAGRLAMRIGHRDILALPRKE